MEKKLLGEYLMDTKRIDQEQLQRALEVQASRLEGGRMPLIGIILVEMGAVNEQDVTFALEQQERDRTRFAL